MNTQYIIKNEDGTFYYKDKKRSTIHREDGPAFEWSFGTKEWWLNGKLHREDGPAIEQADGTKRWYHHGKPHRVDGPAIEYSNGNKYWYLDGKIVSEEEHKKLTRKEPTINIEGKSFTASQLKELINQAK